MVSKLNFVPVSQLSPVKPSAHVQEASSFASSVHVAPFLQGFLVVQINSTKKNNKPLNMSHSGKLVKL